MRTLMAVVVLLGLVGCSDQGPGGDLTREIARNRALWSQARPDSYRYTLELRCFCGYRGPVEVRVQGQSVVSRTAVDGGEPVPEALVSSFPAVDGLFDFLEDAVARDAHQIQVLWDPATGVPLEAWVDYDEAIADEEMGFAVVSLPTAG